MSGNITVGLLPELTSIGPWIAGGVYVCVLGLLMAWRFESGAWRKIDLLGRGEKAPAPAPAPTTAAFAGVPPGPPNAETFLRREDKPNDAEHRT